MIRRETNIEIFLNSALFMVLFVIFVCAFAKNNNPPVTRFSHYKSVSEQHNYSVALNVVHQVSEQKSLVRILDDTDFRLLSDCHKIIDNNKSIHRRLLTLQKTEALVKPVLQQRLSLWYHSSDTGDLPDLS